MSKFEQLWDTEVKALAQACVTEPELINLMLKPDSYELTEDEKKYLKEVSSKVIDSYAMFFISEMIFKVEHGLADGREWQSSLAILHVYSTLHSESYLKEVWHADEEECLNIPLTSRDEYKRLMALRDGLDKLMAVA